MDRKPPIDIGRISVVVLVVVHTDRAVVDHTGVGHLYMVAAGKAPHPLRARSKTYHATQSTYENPRWKWRVFGGVKD